MAPQRWYPMDAFEEPQGILTRRETMERSHTLYSVTLRRLLLSAPLLIALSAPLAAHTQVQKTDERLEHAAKAVDAVTQGPGAAIGGIHGDVTGGPVGLAIDGKGGYVLAAAGERDKKQQQLAQLTQQERERGSVRRRKSGKSVRRIKTTTRTTTKNRLPTRSSIKRLNTTNKG